MLSYSTVKVVIIDPHWNLEKLIMENWSSLKMVIIDPHWNLELIVNADLLDRIRVIIDPHWNLERTKFIYITSRKNGNNRSTLEFRADVSDPRLKSLVVIIDPHWNLEAQGSSPQVLQIR